jgi:hypothetical protein
MIADDAPTMSALFALALGAALPLPLRCPYQAGCYVRSFVQKPPVGNRPSGKPPDRRGSTLLKMSVNNGSMDLQSFERRRSSLTPALAAWIFAGRATPTRGEVVGGFATFRIGSVPHATRWIARKLSQ